MTTQIQPATVQSLPAIFWNGQPVITTDLLASVYETDANNIKQNYKRNANRFTQGTHYFKLTGKELRSFREVSDNLSLSPNTPSLMLWTERGTVRHAKMLGTDKAWDVQDALEQFYFSRQEQPTPTEPPRLTHATKEQREPLVNAVRRLVKVAQSKGHPITYDQAHSIINLKMGVSGIDDMLPEQIPQAMTLVGDLLERVVLSGEYLAKPDAPEQTPAPSHTFQHVPLDQITSRFDVFFRNDPYWSKLSKMSMIVITSVAWNTLRGTLNDDDLCFLNSAMSHLTIPRAHPLDRLVGQIAESLEKNSR